MTDSSDFVLIQDAFLFFVLAVVDGEVSWEEDA